MSNYCTNCKYYEPVVYNSNKEMACLRWIPFYKGTNIIKDGVRFPLCVKQNWYESKIKGRSR